MDVDNLIYECIGAAMEVYNHLGPGLLESVYERAMLFELKLRGIDAWTQVPVEVEYKGEIIGSDFRLDILVDDGLIIELKSVEKLLPVHFKQVRTYMKLLGVPVGLLINFDVNDFRDGFKVIR